MSGLIKICGLAREQDVRLAVDAAPDALGFIFWPRSPRAVTPEQVAEWTRSLPPGMLKVGVFVDQPVEEVRRMVDVAGLDVAQLHGNEDTAYLHDLDRPAWKAVHLDRLPEHLPVPPALALLVDGGTVEMPGGAGVRVDTARAAAFVAQTPFKVLLAGGLKAGNVADAIRGVRPHGVDVSSGVESAPGQKDPEAVRAFVHNARRAFAHLSLETDPT